MIVGKLKRKKDALSIFFLHNIKQKRVFILHVIIYLKSTLQF